VATIRALKMHGGVKKTELGAENVEALDKGFANLERHINNMRKFGLPVMVAVNRFVNDTEAEIDLLIKKCKELGVEVSLNEVWAKGGEGGLDTAKKLVEILENEKADFKPLYDVESSIIEKLNTIVKEMYGADGIVVEKSAMKQIKKLEE
ncbi:formate--tetrahydrofolate ligase, partial [Bacteroidales bacterium MSK.15.36]|nr:formate--tetrahydrofolate ligase [Bacteroidales bacterium MSK.15.36]